MLRNKTRFRGSDAVTSFETLTVEFTRWEQRGRGWTVWPHPVELEPPFRPFYSHGQDRSKAVDDGRKSTFMSTIVDRLLGNSGASRSELSLSEEESEPGEFHSFPLTELQLHLPFGLTTNKETMLQLIHSLTSLPHPVSFEILASFDSIRVQIACPAFLKVEIKQLLIAYIPEVVITEANGFLAQTMTQFPQSAIADFGLSLQFMRPLKTSKRFDPDPLLGLFSVLSGLGQNEIAVMQVLFQLTRHPWAQSILRAVTDLEGKDFFLDSPDFVSAAKEKVVHNLNSVILRCAVASQSANPSSQILQNIALALSNADPQCNRLVPLENNHYPHEIHLSDFLKRQTHRSGMLLNDEELLTFVHVPSDTGKMPKLFIQHTATKPVPAIALGHSFVLGQNTHHQQTETVALSAEQRLKHMYIIGASGTGKSTLLLNLILQDIAQGNGIAVLDPHGDLIDHILLHIPKNRINDVILLDPGDEKYTIPFNMLSAHSETEKNLLASDLVGVFRRLSTSWGDQMHSVLSNAVAAFLESNTGGTLADLRKFLIERDYREQFLRTVTDPEIVYYWQKEFPLLSGRPQAPILTRLDTFLRPKLIRNMVRQKENLIHFREIMDQKHIFLAKLAHGAIGEENSYLLGSLIVSKFHQAAMARQDTKESERKPFYMYIDEFQNFITPSLATSLSGDRKYHLGLTVSHQELRQLWNKDPDVASAAISNPYTRICFRVGDFDAQKLKDGFSFFDAKDLQNLGTGESICRVERSEYDFNLKTLAAPASPQIHHAQDIVAHSRARYSVDLSLLSSRLPELSNVPERIPESKRPSENIERVERPTFLDIDPKTTPKATLKDLPLESPLLGRGGQQHKYLQHLIKRLAEENGYRATIEMPVLDGAGSIDVALQKDEQKIACEISIASTTQMEISNIEKCLRAGYLHIWLISPEVKAREKIRKMAIDQLGDIPGLLFISPDEIPFHIKEMASLTETKEERVKGYKVKVKYQDVDQTQKSSRLAAIRQIMSQGLKKLKH